MTSVSVGYSQFKQSIQVPTSELAYYLLMEGARIFQELSRILPVRAQGEMPSSDAMEVCNKAKDLLEQFQGRFINYT